MSQKRTISKHQTVLLASLGEKGMANFPHSSFGIIFIGCNILILKRLVLYPIKAWGLWPGNLPIKIPFFQKPFIFFI